MKNCFLKILCFITISLTLIKSTLSTWNERNCPSTKGMCSNNQCICNEKYITINNKDFRDNGIYCNYGLKSRFIAFLLEFFFPFGVGHFYSGKIYLATIKLSLFVILSALAVVYYVAFLEKISMHALYQ